MFYVEFLNAKWYNVVKDVIGQLKNNVIGWGKATCIMGDAYYLIVSVPKE